MRCSTRVVPIVLVVLLLARPSVPEGVLLQRGLKLTTQVQGSRLHISLENASREDIKVYNSFSSPYAPDGWPQFCYLQLRTYEGQVLVYDNQGNDLWTPWTRVSEAILPPVELQTLKPGDAWRTEMEIESTIKQFVDNVYPTKERSTLGIKDARVFLRVHLRSDLSEAVLLYTDWFEVRAGAVRVFKVTNNQVHLTA